jgi:hypothetical protein
MFIDADMVTVTHRMRHLFSQKVNESVLLPFMLLFTVSFSANFLDVNFKSTKALKLYIMIHTPTLIT